MTSNELDEKINDLIENDDTENFYSLISEIIEENREYASDLDQNLNEAFNIISDNINESNHDKKISFLCLFFEILISENIDFSNYLQKTFEIIKSSGVYSDENIKRIINICSNATIKKKDLFNNLTQFSKDKIEYLYIIFSLVGFKQIIVDNLSDNWELIIDLLDNPEIKSNSNSIKNLLKCLELLINLSEGKFRPYASSALYQALDYLTETDIELQKRSLMIIYSLTKFCDEQLKPLSDNIIDFLKVLQNGNNIEINNLCNTMLKHFTGKKDEEENANNEDSNGNINETENNMNENESENDNYNNSNENGNKITTEKENIDKIGDKNNQNEKHDDNNENNYYNINEDNENENDNGNDYDHEKNLQNNYVPEEKQEKEEEESPDQKDYKNEQNEYRNENEENESRNIYRNDYKNEDDNEENAEYNKNERNNEQENEEENRYNYKNIIRKEEGQSSIVNNTNSINQRSNKRDFEESEKDYNNKEINRNNNFNNNNNKNFNNNEDNLNNIDINAIIKKIKDLSDKQIIILDSIEQYKRDTKRIINQKKVKIQALEAKIEELKEKIRIEKNKKRNKPGQTNYQMRRKKNNNNRNDYNDEYDQYNDYRY